MMREYERQKWSRISRMRGEALEAKNEESVLQWLSLNCGETRRKQDVLNATRGMNRMWHTNPDGNDAQSAKDSFDTYNHKSQSILSQFAITICTQKTAREGMQDMPKEKDGPHSVPMNTL